MQDATPLPKDGPSTDMEMDIDLNDESDTNDIVLTRPRQNRVSYSKIVQVDSDTSDKELDGPSYAPDTERQISPRNMQMDDDRSKDMTSGVIGRKVPAQSGTVRWQDGRLTVLPTIMKNSVNICESGDIKVVKFFASFQESTPSSQHVLHLSAADMEREDIVQMIEFSLRDNKPVVVRGNAINSPNDITTEWLDRKFGISPDMPVSIHGKCRRIFQSTSFHVPSQMPRKRVADSTYPHIAGTISSLVDAMNDPTKIQCVLDIPYVHGGLPEPLR